MLTNFLNRILYERGSPVQALPYLQEAWGIVKKHGVPASDQNLLIDLLLALGGVASEMTDTKSCISHSNRLKSLQKVQSKLWVKIRKPDVRLAAAESLHGIACTMKNDYKKAQTHFKQSIELYAHVPGVHPLEAGLPSVYLGYIYYLQGSLTEAGRLFSTVLPDGWVPTHNIEMAYLEVNQAFYR